MRLGHCSCAGLRRVCATVRTGSKRQYSHFRLNLSAPVDILLRQGSAGCARYIAIFRPNQNVSVLVRVFNMLNILPASSARPNADSVRADTSSAVYCRKLFTRKVSLNYDVAVTSVTSTQPRRLSGRAHAFCDHARATRLAEDEHSRCTAPMLRLGCAEVTPFITAYGKPRRNRRHHVATAVDHPHSIHACLTSITQRFKWYDRMHCKEGGFHHKDAEYLSAGKCEKKKQHQGGHSTLPIDRGSDIQSKCVTPNDKSRANMERERACTVTRYEGHYTGYIVWRLFYRVIISW